jgi:hypothetical protein
MKSKWLDISDKFVSYMQALLQTIPHNTSSALLCQVSKQLPSYKFSTY